MLSIYKLFCAIGLHQWVRGKGWIEDDAHNGHYHEGHRCCWCGKEKE